MDDDFPKESMFESWAYWRSYLKQANPISLIFRKRGYTFPEPLYPNYDSAMRTEDAGVCPWCNNKGYFFDSGTQSTRFCIRELLQWQSTYVQDIHNVQRNCTPIPNKPISELILPLDPQQKASLSNNILSARNWMEKPDRWVLMVGDPGVGKTYIASAIYREFAPIAIFMTAGDFSSLMFSSLGDNTTEYITGVLSTIPLLFLDDWGMEQGGKTEWIDKQLRQVINARYTSPKAFPTIITTNMGLTQMFKSNPRMADRVADRRNLIMQFQNISFRRNEGKTYGDNSTSTSDLTRTSVSRLSGAPGGSTR
jgi:DNA replication protein DnaC